MMKATIGALKGAPVLRGWPRICPRAAFWRTDTSHHHPREHRAISGNRASLCLPLQPCAQWIELRQPKRLQSPRWCGATVLPERCQRYDGRDVEARASLENVLGARTLLLAFPGEYIAPLD